MTITATQREQRRKHLGSSDMAAVMGFDPFKNAHDVYLEKTGKLEDEKSDKAIFKRGNYMEFALLQFAEDELGELVRNQYRSAKIRGIPIGTNIDAILNATGAPIEAKSQGWYAPEYWGEPGTDEIPDRAIIQSHCHMICTDTQFCHVPVYLAKREFLMYGVSFDADIAGNITDAAVAFWNDHVLKDIPPENVTPSLATLKRVIRTPETVAELDPDIVKQWQMFNDAKLGAERAANAYKAIVIAALGQADGGKCSLGTLTYFEQNRKAYSVEAGKYRVLKFKKGKSNGK